MGEREGALIRVKGFGESYLRRKRRQRQASSVSQPFCVKTIHSIYHNWCVGERELPPASGREEERTQSRQRTALPAEPHPIHCQERDKR